MKRLILSSTAAALLLTGPSAPTHAQSGPPPAPVPAAPAKKINIFIITGEMSGHDWRARAELFQKFLPKDRFNVTIGSTPVTDLTTENLSKYDVLMISYK